MFTIFQQVFGFRWPIPSMYQDFMKFWCLNPDWLVVSNLFIFHFIYGMSSFPLTSFHIFQDGYCTTNQLSFGGQNTFFNPWVGRLQLSSSGTPGLGSGSHSRTWLGPQSGRSLRVRGKIDQLVLEGWYYFSYIRCISLEDLSKNYGWYIW